MANGANIIRQMIMKDMRKAMNVVSEKALADLYEETGGFYTGGDPKVYERTGALGDTPKTTAITSSGKTLSFDAYLDQTYQYSTGDNPSMTQVLALANDGTAWVTASGATAKPTVGRGGFWDRAEEKIGKDFESTFSQFFN